MPSVRGGLDSLYTVNVADGSLALIRSGNYLVRPAFSPDGTKITYFGYDTGGLDAIVRVVSLNADGSGTPTPLIPDDGRGASFQFPDWGPA